MAPYTPMHQQTASDNRTSTSAPRLRNEDAIVAKIRQHLREAAGNEAVKGINFTFAFNRRGVASAKVGVDVHYDYLEGQDAV